MLRRQAAILVAGKKGDVDEFVKLKKKLFKMWDAAPEPMRGKLGAAVKRLTPKTMLVQR